MVHVWNNDDWSLTQDEDIWVMATTNKELCLRLSSLSPRLGRGHDPEVFILICIFVLAFINAQEN